MFVYRKCFDCWKDFDADDAFSFTTERQVRIRDRYLGIPYYTMLLGIVLYIGLYVIYYGQAYMLLAPATGLTRLQLVEPATEYLKDLSEYEYCGLNNETYQSDYMKHKWYKSPCEYRDANAVVFPPDEVNAMFITTRLSTTSVKMPVNNTCDPRTELGCKYDEVSRKNIYVPDIRFYTLKFDHSMDVPLLDLSSSTAQMKAKGLQNEAGDTIQPCQIYWDNDYDCPDHIVGFSSFGDILPLGALFMAAGIEGSSLDSPLNPNATATPDTLVETRRNAGIVIIVDIEYSGSLSLRHSGSLTGLEYVFKVRDVEGSEYKIEAREFSSRQVEPDALWTLADRHGVRVVVRQTGQIGQFNMQQLLVALVSSIALLTIAKKTVECMAFSMFPLRKIYGQYRRINTIDFSDLDDQHKSVFMKHDIINPEPFKRKQPLHHIPDEISMDTRENYGTLPGTPPEVGPGPGGAGPAPGGGAGAGAGVGGGGGGGGGASQTRSATTVQQHVHNTQDGFWGDLTQQYQGGGEWDGDARQVKEWA